VKALLTALGAGLLFGLGLVVSGMTDPSNVIGFLDLGGDWKPALALVMAGAIAVHATLLWLGRRRAAADTTTPEPRRAIDAALLIGSATFGVGWGLSGYCPGPAIVALGFGSTAALGFVLAMVVGTLAADMARRPRA
jgi:uncharacterized protein